MNKYKKGLRLDLKIENIVHNCVICGVYQHHKQWWYHIEYGRYKVYLPEDVVDSLIFSNYTIKNFKPNGKIKFK